MGNCPIRDISITVTFYNYYMCIRHVKFYIEENINYTELKLKQLQTAVSLQLREPNKPFTPHTINNVHHDSSLIQL